MAQNGPLHAKVSPIRAFITAFFEPKSFRGCVANVLITWCRDHICRIWCETSVPTEIASDMLLDLKSERFPPRVGGGGALGAGADDKDRHKHHRLKNARVKITHRLKHLK